jgi:mannose-6-phosphate isomerase-like protein (cupin superfamily)
MFLRGKDWFAWKVSSSDTAGGVAILEGTVSAGAGPVLHRRLHQNEWWYVLEGQFKFQVGEEIFRVEPGASVFGAQGVPHAFRCVSEAPGKMLFMFDPARQIEEFFAELVALGTNAGAGRHSEKDLFTRHGIEWEYPEFRV